MANIQKIRRELDKDELDYPALADTYGEAILPQLKAIVAEDVPRLASKAAYLAGLIAGNISHDIVALAARSRHNVVRVSAASATALLPTLHAVKIASTLLDDADPGVRVRAAKSAGKIGHATLSARLREMATQDTDAHVRALAADLSSMPREDNANAESPAQRRMGGVDMTEGAAAGRMPGVEAPDGQIAGRMPDGEMAEGAVARKKSDVETHYVPVARHMGAGDMTEGAAAGRMAGVETLGGSVARRMGDGDMTEGAAAGRMPGVDM